MTRLLKTLIPTSVLALFFAELVITAGSYVAVLSLFMKDYDPAFFLLQEDGWLRLGLLTVVILLAIYFSDLYESPVVRHPVELLQQLSFVLGVAFLTEGMLSWLKRDWAVPRTMMVEGSIVALVLLFLLRMLYSWAAHASLGAERVLFLGRSSLVFQVGEHLLKNPELGFRPVGYIDETSAEQAPVSAVPRLSEIPDLMKIVREQKPDLIVVGMHDRRERVPQTELLNLRFSGIRIYDIATLYEIVYSRVCVRKIRPSQLIFTANLGPRPNTVRLQSAYSRVLALIGVIVLSPLMVVVAIAVRLTSRGPALFRQVRVGLHEKPFTLYKFRSMRQDAEAETGAVWATRNDPRITPLGRLLRNSRLDEMPQLFNVLKGDMALVGPRPERPEFVQKLNESIPFYRQRHFVLPGVTGWAQVNYKYGESFEDTIMKLEYDLYYIKNVSTWLDVMVMFRTAKTILLSRGGQ